MRGRRGVSTIEYTALIAVMAAIVLVSMIYLRQGGEGYQRGAADDVGNQFSMHHTTYDYTTTSNAKRHDTTAYTGFSKSQLTDDEKQSRTGTEDITADLGSQNLWDGTAGGGGGGGGP